MHKDIAQFIQVKSMNYDTQHDTCFMYGTLKNYVKKLFSEVISCLLDVLSNYYI